MPEVASLRGRETSVVLRIDSVRKNKPACLDDYMRYADILGSSLCEIFDETALQDLLVPASEAQLLEQVEQAIHYLKASGKPLLPGNIGKLIGLIGQRGPQYPRANTLLSRGETEREQ